MRNLSVGTAKDMFFMSMKTPFLIEKNFDRELLLII